MWVLVLAQIASTLDRGIFNLVVDPVRRDLGASDVQISLLQGLAFGIFYVTVGVPLGAVADIVSRRRLLAGGMAVWSLATVWGGFAHDFNTMFISRLFVGLGEGVLGPSAVSLIADLFPLSRRGRPSAVYLLGGALSGGISTMITGAVLAAATAGAFARTPVIGALSPWRIAFVIAGLTGLIPAALALTMADPARRGAGSAPKRGLGLRQAAAHFASQWGVFLPYYLSVGLFIMATSCISAWGPSLVVRRFHWTPAHTGQVLGLANIAAALIGAGAAWFLVDRVVRRAGLAGKLAFAPWIPWAAAPCALAVLAPGPWAAVALLAEMLVVMPVFGSTMFLIPAELVPSAMKGVFGSLYALFGAIIGGICGPFLVALLTEKVFHRPEMVGYSLLCVVMPALIGSSLMLLLCKRGFHRALASSERFGEIIAAHEG
jgi:MFS family permease